jgi:hypothetical protein
MCPWEQNGPKLRYFDDDKYEENFKLCVDAHIGIDSVRSEIQVSVMAESMRSM